MTYDVFHHKRTFGGGAGNSLSRVSRKFLIARARFMLQMEGHLKGFQKSYINFLFISSRF